MAAERRKATCTQESSFELIIYWEIDSQNLVNLRTQSFVHRKRIGKQAQVLIYYSFGYSLNSATIGLRRPRGTTNIYRSRAYDKRSLSGSIDQALSMS